MDTGKLTNDEAYCNNLRRVRFPIITIAFEISIVAFHVFFFYCVFACVAAGYHAAKYFRVSLYIAHVTGTVLLALPYV
jgi:hypothetical protein